MKIKKTVSILLAVFMLVGILPITGMAKNAYTVGTTDAALKTVREILFYEDFDNLTVDTNVSNDQVLGNTEYYTLKVSGISNTVKIQGNAGDKYLYMRGNNKGTDSVPNWSYAQIVMSTFGSSVGKFTGTYVTEFKWKQTEGESAIDSLFMQTNASDYYGPRLAIDSGVGLQYYNQGSPTRISGAGTSTPAYSGAWHNARIVTYVDDLKYDVYIDGRLLVNGAPFRDALKGTTSFAGLFWVNGVRTGICYDDIVIYREAIDRTVWGAEDFSGYGETRDWSSWQNEELESSTKISTNNDWKTDSVDRYDTWLEGLELYPLGINQHGVIDSANDNLKLNGNALVRVAGYQNATKTKDGAGLSFTFSAEKPEENHDYIVKMTDIDGKNGGVSIKLKDCKFKAETSSGDVVILDGVQANRTYNFTIWCNRTTGKYTVYIDGNCVATDLEFIKADGVTTISDIGRIFIADISSISGACYYDDLVFFYDKRDNIAQEAMMALNAENGLIESLGKGETSVPFPAIAEGYTGYTLNWTSSDSNAINPETGAVNYGFTAKNVTLTAEITDSNREYTLKRSINVRVPAALELSARWENDKALCSAQVSGNADYSDTKVYLAIYGSGDTLLGVKTGSIVSGAELTPATALTTGSYTIKAFALDSKLVPKCVNATASFVIE